MHGFFDKLSLSIYKVQNNNIKTDWEFIMKNVFSILCLSSITVLSAIAPTQASASRECMIGEVVMFAGNFAPRNFAFADGQLLAISSNSALFSILGTIYGGDGRSTFALPDLRGRVPVGPRTGPGLSNIREGQKFGSESVSLQASNIPNLTSWLDLATKGGLFKAETASNGGVPLVTLDVAIPPKKLRSGLVKHDALPSPDTVNKHQPSLGMNYIICTQGIYPSRS